MLSVRKIWRRGVSQTGISFGLTENFKAKHKFRAVPLTSSDFANISFF